MLSTKYFNDLINQANELAKQEEAETTREPEKFDIDKHNAYYDKDPTQ